IELPQLEAASAAEPIPGSEDEHHDVAHADDAHEHDDEHESDEHEQHDHEHHDDEHRADAAAADAPELIAQVEAVDGETSEPVAAAHNITEVNGNAEGEEEAVESVGGADALEEVPERMPRVRRQYKIQEVIKRRQVMLVQVVKEERGTKGA